MLLSNQQKYILEILKEFKYLRVRQLHALVQAHYRTQGIKIDERRMEIMLRQMRMEHRTLTVSRWNIMNRLS